MAKKAPAVVVPVQESVQTRPLPIPESKFKTIWQVVGTPAATASSAKTKAEKTAVAA